MVYITIEEETCNWNRQFIGDSCNAGGARFAYPAFENCRSYTAGSHQTILIKPDKTGEVK